MSEVLDVNTTPEVEQTPTLSEQTKAFAATNTPSLAPDEFSLGDRTFKVVFLGYHAQLKFLALMQPLLGVIAQGMTNRYSDLPAGLGIDSSQLTVASVLKYLGQELPELAALVCNGQAEATKDSSIRVTSDWVLEQERVSPFLLAKVVMKQIAVNNLIGEIADFFTELLPAMKALNGAKVKMKK